MVPSTLPASACDEQLMSIGGEIALSRNTQTHKKKSTLQSCTGAGRAKRPLKHAIKKRKNSKTNMSQQMRFRCGTPSRCTGSLHVVGLSEPQRRLPTDRGHRRGGGLEAYVCQQCPTSNKMRGQLGRHLSIGREENVPENRFFALQDVSIEF